MALATYSDLQTSVANFLHRSDLTSVIPDLITLAETNINGDLDARLQDTKTSVSTVASTDYITLPTDLINIRHVSVETDPVYTLIYMTPDQFEKSYPTTATGIPNNYTVIGDKMYLGPTPDAVYGVDIIYKAKVPALSITNTTNYILTNYPNVYLYGALSEAAVYIKDTAIIQLVQAKYNEAIQSVNAQDWYSGSTMVVKSGVTT